MFLSTDIFTALGRRGTGKSTLANVVSRTYPRVVTFDSIHEFNSSHGEIVSGFHEFSEVILGHHKKGSKKFHVIIQFDLDNENNLEEFNQCLRVLYFMGGVFIRIEEIQNFCTPHTMPHWLSHCLTTGRHRKLGMIFTTQMPRNCNKALISQSAHVFCGQLHERNDIEYVRSVLGDRAFELMNIPPRKFLYFQPGEPIRLVNNSLD